MSKGMVKSYSIAGDGTMSNLTPAQMGRQELYQVRAGNGICNVSIFTLILSYFTC